MDNLSPQVSLFVPGLFNAPQWPALSVNIQRVFALARPVHHNVHIMGFDAQLLSQDPIASAFATTRQKAKNKHYSKHCLYVDFIEYRADIKEVFCIGQKHLKLSEFESSQLKDSLIPYLPENVRWQTLDRDCLVSDKPWQISTCSLDDIIGTAMTHKMPQGDDKGALSRLQTEWQMLLFNHPVNQARKAQGLPVANGVWMWGQVAPADTGIVSLWVDDKSLAVGNIHFTPDWDALVEAIIDNRDLNTQIYLKQGRRLLDQAKPEPWRDWFLSLGESFIMPLLASGAVSGVNLVSDNGRGLFIKRPRWLDRFKKFAFHADDYFRQND